MIKRKTQKKTEEITQSQTRFNCPIYSAHRIFSFLFLSGSFGCRICMCICLSAGLSVSLSPSHFFFSNWILVVQVLIAWCNFQTINRKKNRHRVRKNKGSSEKKRERMPPVIYVKNRYLTPIYMYTKFQAVEKKRAWSHTDDKNFFILLPTNQQRQRARERKN